MNKGKIVQVMGPVVDVEFSQQPLPHIKDAPDCGKRRQTPRDGSSAAYWRGCGTMYHAFSQ